MFEYILKHRQAVAENIEKSLQIGYTESDDFEKAHSVGDVHPNGKWVWTKLPSGKYDWRVIKKTSQGTNKTWDDVSSFQKTGSDENKLWGHWYKFQKSGDPTEMSHFRSILEKKFPNVAQWVQTSPNTGKSEITAKDHDGKVIASIDLSGNKVDFPKLQTFMDKCFEAKKETTKKSLKVRNNF